MTRLRVLVRACLVPLCCMWEGSEDGEKGKVKGIADM